MDRIPQIPRVLVLWEREEELERCKEITPDRLPGNAAVAIYEKLLELGYQPKLVACEYCVHGCYTHYLAIIGESMGFVKTVFLGVFP